MVYEEIAPYLNKIVRMNLKLRKRKLGYLVVDFYHQVSREPLKEVHCVNVRFGKKHFPHKEYIDIQAFKHHSEVLQIEDILNIRSCL
jgi:hypothetical protein